MKYLGIDYGSKHVGLAISDSAGQVAMPTHILPNTASLDQDIAQIITAESIDAVVIGESLNLSGGENIITPKIKQFGAQLGQTAGVPVSYSNEQFSSRAAKWGTVKDIRSNPRNTPKHQRGGNTREDRVDDKAAAIILQSYLDSQ